MCVLLDISGCFVIAVDLGDIYGGIGVFHGGVWLDCVVQVQSVTWAGVSISPSPLIPLPSRERGLVGCVVLFILATLPPCGFPPTRE